MVKTAAAAAGTFISILSSSSRNPSPSRYRVNGDSPLLDCCYYRRRDTAHTQISLHPVHMITPRPGRFSSTDSFSLYIQCICGRRILSIEYKSPSVFVGSTSSTRILDSDGAAGYSPEDFLNALTVQSRSNHFFGHIVFDWLRRTSSDLIFIHIDRLKAYSMLCQV